MPQRRGPSLQRGQSADLRVGYSVASLQNMADLSGSHIRSNSDLTASAYASASWGRQAVQKSGARLELRVKAYSLATV